MKLPESINGHRPVTPAFLSPPPYAQGNRVGTALLGVA